ncbi:hypothetical protein QJS66_16895 [Kocuria rhizophila]|nr:hypothetical protein QJS66_16895 [Kocuria rhizophila]
MLARFSLIHVAPDRVPGSCARGRSACRSAVWCWWRSRPWTAVAPSSASTTRWLRVAQPDVMADHLLRAACAERWRSG